MAATGKSEVQFRERAELLDFLLEVSRVTAETLDLDEQLAAIATIVKEVVPYDLFAILLYNEREKGLAIRYAIGHREEIVKSLIVSLNEGIVGAAAAGRKPVVVPDVHLDPRYLNALDAVRSELAVPLVARGRVVGVLDVQSTRVNAFTERESTMLRLIGSRVAISIDNARLFRRVEKQNRTSRTMAELSREFSSILDLDELLKRIAESVRTLINYDAFGIFLVDAPNDVLRTRFSARYDERVEIANIPMGKGITGSAVETRLPVRVADTAADSRYIASHQGVRSELAVPLMVQDRVVGVLNVESEKINFFSEEHQRVLMMLAPQIASSVENARLYEELATREQMLEQDLKAARKLQRLLLQSAPELPGLSVGIRSRPAREISGDVYDFFESSEESSVIAFGDVSGKGAAAALYGALISGLLRILGPRRKTPAILIKSLNETLLERKVDAQYATLFVAFWQPQTRMLRMANAGACAPLVWRQGEILKPRIEGVPIGLLEDIDYEELEVTLEPGDVVLLYSDGVEDQVNAKGEEFGRSRVLKLLKKHHADTPKDVANAVIAELDEYRGGTAISDDQSVIVLRVP
ncbi:MAG: GAF domain-containing SpoIIE family protein phosphatase [Bryobacteraceae bacterium]